ncbi:hypothetical protein ACP3S8_19955 [Mixta calida]|uniref:hypothetical protein n=1 Tax=Mixta calida TaxID=665913 RepID=UPI003CFA2BBB
MKMTNEERQALISQCKERLEMLDGMTVSLAVEQRKIYRIALAALTAEPVKVPDEMHTLALQAGDSHGYGMGWNACRAEVLRLNAIDNTAQQYEALAGWKMVPIEPTAAMYDAGDKQLATKQVWDAMLAAAPKPEGQ